MSNNELIEEDEKFIDQWMIRPCWLYKAEYDECTCFRGRFHQYFIHGHKLDCSAWKKDYNNCNIWESEQSQQAYDALINSENERRRERLRGHYGNKVWKKRETPPENWNAPLPDWLQERIEKSKLYNLHKEEEKRKAENKEKYCTIM